MRAYGCTLLHSLLRHREVHAAHQEIWYPSSGWRETCLLASSERFKGITDRPWQLLMPHQQMADGFEAIG